MKQTHTTSGANAERSRAHNRRVVMGKIHSAHEIGRAEIARASGLTTQTVSNIIAELETEGYLREAGRRIQGRGLPAVQYSINASGGYALGIEVRPTALFAAVLDLGGTNVATWRLPLSKATPAETLCTLEHLMLDVKRTVQPERIIGAGIAMPGPFGRTGLSGSAHDLPGWEDKDLTKLFSEALELPVQIENDANAAAMAERVTGVAKGLSTYAYLYFGTGLGLGLVSQGQLIAGAFGNAGEIGQLPVNLDGTIAQLESVASRSSIQRHMNNAGIDVSEMDTLDTLHAAQSPALSSWTEQAAKALGQAVAIIENLFDPQAVILGGAMPSRLLKDITNKIPLNVASVSHRPDAPHDRVILGQCGRLTATNGAASLVLNRVYTPVFGPAA